MAIKYISNRLQVLILNNRIKCTNQTNNANEYCNRTKAPISLHTTLYRELWLENPKCLIKFIYDGTQLLSLSEILSSWRSLLLFDQLVKIKSRFAANYKQIRGGRRWCWGGKTVVIGQSSRSPTLSAPKEQVCHLINWLSKCNQMRSLGSVSGNTVPGCSLYCHPC